jgi:uncharacterized membrane protein YcgQ (UPF0703/DUF1980 family)
MIRVGILELLTVLFVALKLLGYIDWSWWLVFAPMYVYAFFIALWLLMAVWIGVLQGIEQARINRRFKK